MLVIFFRAIFLFGKSVEAGNVERRNIFTVILSIFRTTASKTGINTVQVKCTWKQKHKIEESESEFYLKKNIIQLQYVTEANSSMDYRNNPLKTFPEVKKKKTRTVNISHAVHDILSILYLFLYFKQKLYHPTTKIFKWFNRLIYWHCSARVPCYWKKKKDNKGINLIKELYIMWSASLPFFGSTSPGASWKFGICRLGANVQNPNQGFIMKVKHYPNLVRMLWNVLIDCYHFFKFWILDFGLFFFLLIVVTSNISSINEAPGCLFASFLGQ